MMKLNILNKLSILTILIYSIKYPDSEKFGLQSQIRRAMISASLNIREGNVFTGKKKINFFNIARGSLEEVDQCMILSLDLQFIDQKTFDTYRLQYWESLNMLNKLIRSISSK